MEGGEVQKKIKSPYQIEFDVTLYILSKERGEKNDA
jgi:hypothetical protein